MTLSHRIGALTQLTLKDPRRAARALLAEAVPMRARTVGLLLVAVLSALLGSLQVGSNLAGLDPFTRFMLATPFRAAAFQWLFLAISAVLVYRVGRAFGGRGSFPDALLVVVWLQLPMLALQLLQLAVDLVAQPLAGLIGLGALALFVWLMTSFVAELHGFRSRGKVLVGLLLTALASGLLLGIVMILIFGPEAFADV